MNRNHFILFTSILMVTAKLLWAFGQGILPTSPELWTEGFIYYEIDPNFKKPERVAEAIMEWESRTSIRFIKRKNEINYARFINGQEPHFSSSSVGMRGGKQTVSIGYAVETGTVLHEIGHLVGMEHEHQRRDRHKKTKQYVFEFHPENVDAPINLRHFEPLFDPLIRTYGEYDPDSLMHYEPGTFSKSDKHSTFTVYDRKGRKLANPGQKTGRRHLSLGDIDTIQEMYKLQFKKRVDELAKFFDALK